MEKKFNPYEKPPENLCPEKYCFKWATTHYSLEKPVCTAMECRRSDPSASLDAYEPNEMKLAADGLPWFYFTHWDNMVEVIREKFLRESQKYWGNKNQQPEW